MSCLTPAPLPDLVTKEFLSAELSAQLAHYATKEDLQRLETRLESKIDQLLLLREADRKDSTAQREADRKEAKHQFFWLIGTIIAAHGALAGYGIIF